MGTGHSLKLLFVKVLVCIIELFFAFLLYCLVFVFFALQVQSWFCDKQAKSAYLVVPFKPKKRNDGLKTAMIKKRAKGSSFMFLH